MFGNTATPQQQQTTTGGGLFGNTPAAQPNAMTGGGLFGSRPAAATTMGPGGGLFGGAATTQQSGGGLFGGTTPAATATTGGGFLYARLYSYWKIFSVNANNNAAGQLQLNRPNPQTKLPPSKSTMTTCDHDRGSMTLHSQSRTRLLSSTRASSASSR